MTTTRRTRDAGRSALPACLVGLPHTGRGPRPYSLWSAPGIDLRDLGLREGARHEAQSRASVFAARVRVRGPPLPTHAGAGHDPVDFLSERLIALGWVRPLLKSLLWPGRRGHKRGRNTARHGFPAIASP
ncbi:hypothetical protein, partial [Acidiferrobacter sp.]|uniref:hypothetical protein n=1 Tax=Acidiferrobacter sp. TaxID=1872107 RepID=UPI0026341331